jgi:DNA-directed RNA polymerase sigma subunit (sigma70/sigma32)
MWHPCAHVTECHSKVRQILAFFSGPRPARSLQKAPSELQLEGFKSMRAENDDLKSHFRDVRRFSPMKRQEERALARRYRAGDSKAGEKLVTANLRFVVKVANEYRAAGLSFADLV